MVEAAVILLRLLQYAAGSVLMGSALFALYALPEGERSPNWRFMLAVSALVLACAATLGLVAQTALLAGSFEAALTSEALQAVAGGMSLGTAAVIRAGTAALALIVLLAAPPGRPLWATAAALGAVAVASFAWMGHGAATVGAAGGWHLAADIVHALAAAAWIGALAGFVVLVRGSADPATLHTALRRFSAVGIPLVAVLALTGLVNSWFLVGLDGLAELVTAPYGRLLLVKLALFAGMLVLATANRSRHTPAIAAQLAAPASDPAILARLRRSIVAEMSLGLGALAAVAWLGMLEPPGSA